MRLIYLRVNMVYAFVMGTQLIRLDGYDTFFDSEEEAVAAARDRGLKVDNRGKVSAINPSNMNGLRG